MATIFLSYRRDGGSGYAGRISDELARRFGDAAVFRDVDDLASGDDFVEALDRALQSCRIVLVVIGRTWLTATGPDGRRRLDDPRDFVRREISVALARGILLVPVLVDGARMPAEADLPDDLRPLARRQAHELSDSRWSHDIGRLADSIAGAFQARIEPGADSGPLLAGTWDMPSGSYWIVEQTGRQLAIQEVHYDSRQVWKKGQGTIEDAVVLTKR